MSIRGSRDGTTAASVLAVRLGSADRLFAGLRLLAVAGGLAWILTSGPASPAREVLLFNLLFFALYSTALYVAIFLVPGEVRRLYLGALVLDLAFLFWLVHFTGGFRSDFYLGFLLLIALHSFYFGPGIGLTVVGLASVDYLAAGGLDFTQAGLANVALRLAFFLLVGLSMGLLSRKEQRDRRRIENLNRQLGREKEKVEKILVGIGAGLVLVNREMRIAWMNEVAESWFGPLEDLRGRRCAEALWRCGEICSCCPTSASFREGSVARCERQRSLESGEIQCFRLTSAPIRNDEGEPAHVLELIQDITEEKALQEQLVQSGKLAAMGESAAGIVHEINNPLGSIAVCAQDLAAHFSGRIRVEEGELVDLVRCIRSEIERCKRITRGFLDLARRRGTRLEPADLDRLVERSTLLARHRAEVAGVAIRFDLCGHLPPVVVECDAVMQVFVNLLINAVDFSERGSHVEIRTESLPGSRVAVRFRDRGCGIPPENLSRIFQPFFTTRPEGEGTGLGLAICKRIVEGFGGEIRVESGVGRGTTVSVLFPAVPSPRGARKPVSVPDSAV